MTSKLFKRYKEINKEYICTDKHVHTTWVDGKSSISELVERAKILGMRQIAFTEHVRKDSTYFPQYLEEIYRIRDKENFDIVAGFESKVCNFNGELDLPEDAYNSADIIIASVHRFPFGRKLYQPSQFTKKICQDVELELAIAAIEKEKCNIIGHPGGLSLQAYGEFPLSYFEEIIAECKRHDVAFDLNKMYHYRVFFDLKPLLKKYNPYVSLGSDAHSIDELGGWFGILQGELINE